MPFATLLAPPLRYAMITYTGNIMLLLRAAIDAVFAFAAPLIYAAFRHLRRFILMRYYATC